MKFYQSPILKPLAVLVCCLFSMLFLFGCSSDNEKHGILSQTWSEIEASADGGQVKFYMYGGNPAANKWVDSYVAEVVKERFGITLVRVPLAADTVVAKLLEEKNGTGDAGGVDLLWLNGKNYRVAREGELLFGPFSEKLPNFIKHVNKRLAAFDFGYPVEGYESPLGRAQFVFEYNSDKVKNPPKSYIDLLRWVTENPGRFTYPAPPDFTGAAFVRQLFFDVAGSPKRFEPGWDEKLYNGAAKRVWEYLNEMKPYLWRAGLEYPKDTRELDKLFASGEIDISMSYNPQHASAKIREKVFGPQTRTFVLELGTLYNIHFVAIPQSAPNKAGAMVVANFLLSPEAQLSKFKPDNWGDYPALDINSLNKEQWDGFVAVKRSPATIPPKELVKKGVPEIPSEYGEALDRDWQKNIK